jgi:hypothetical protein
MSRAIALVIAAAAAGCAPSTKTRKEPVSHKAPLNPACRDAILAFAELELDRWHGLPPCTHDDLAAVLGAGGPEWQGGFGLVHIYAGRAATPDGITVHYRGERAVYLIASGERLPRARIEPMLGTPESVAPSRLFEPQNEQWIYASRGLTLHVHRGSHEPLRVYGYTPMTVEEFEKTELFYERASEYPTH